MTSKLAAFVSVEDVIVPPNRQRKDINVDDLLDSIKRRGVVTPIIIKTDYTLVAGERRLTASKKLGLPVIPARFLEDLSQLEARIIELEENLKRKNLEWKEEVEAIATIHKAYVSMNPEWTQKDTAFELCISQQHIAHILRVAENFEDPRVSSAATLRTAYNIISRSNERKAADAMSDLVSTINASPIPTSTIPTTSTTQEAPVTVKRTAIEVEPAENSILQMDFTEWAKEYKGLPFNLIHCDFPYGLYLDKSEQAKSSNWGGYDDSPETYQKLVTALISNLDRLMAPSAHMMFWCASDLDKVTQTITWLEAAGLRVFRVPLIWIKTDNKGITSDPRRRPKHIYETCLMVSRGDRYIAKSISDAYGAPGTKEIHQSEKPEPMLRHFFKMFVDTDTRLLDPTCGSGTALRAAESLGAKLVIGLEINPEFCKDAQAQLRKFRVMRAAQKLRTDTEDL